MGDRHYERSMEIHRRIEALYSRVEEQVAYFRGMMRADPALSIPPATSPGVVCDPIVCALAVKAATTKRAIALLCQHGDGDNALALTRVLMENACLLEWLLRGEGRRRLETYVMFTSVLHEQAVATIAQFRERFRSAGADPSVDSDPYHRAVSECLFSGTKDDRATWAFSPEKGVLRRVSVKQIFTEVTGDSSFEYEMLYSMGSDIVHSGPFSLTRTLQHGLKRRTFMLQALPVEDGRTIALAVSNAAMLLVLASFDEYVGLGLAEELETLRVESRKDPE